MKFQVFKTKEEATNYAVEKYSKDYVEFNVVNVIKIGPQLAKLYECEEGYAVDKEIDGED